MFIFLAPAILKSIIFAPLFCFLRAGHFCSAYFCAGNFGAGHFDANHIGAYVLASVGFESDIKMLNHLVPNLLVLIFLVPFILTLVALVLIFFGIDLFGAHIFWAGHFAVDLCEHWLK